jgi:uncharacterized membrane protein YkvA (DUF1232 family)
VPLIAELKERARRLKGEVIALYLAARHPGTPWYAKLFLAAIVAYALSPIDLIPDFIPVLGLVDEIILLPFAILLAVKMIPAGVMAECRSRASQLDASGSWMGRIGAAIIVSVWLTLIVLAAIGAHNAFAHERSLPDYIDRPETMIEPRISSATFARYSLAFAASPAFSAALAAPAVAPSRLGSFFSVASNAASASA